MVFLHSLLVEILFLSVDSERLASLSDMKNHLNNEYMVRDISFRYKQLRLTLYRI